MLTLSILLILVNSNTELYYSSPEHESKMVVKAFREAQPKVKPTLKKLPLIFFFNNLCKLITFCDDNTFINILSYLFTNKEK